LLKKLGTSSVTFSKPMALITTIRKHSGILVSITAIGLFLFLIGGDILRVSPIASGQRKEAVGEVEDQKITLQAYQAQVNQLRQVSASNAGSRKEKWIREQAWQQLVAQIVYKKECDTLGLMISEDELVDMVQGEHIHPELKTAFLDPKTKQFDKQQLIHYLQKLSQMPVAQQAPWRQFEHGLSVLRTREKVVQLMTQSTFVSGLEAQTQHHNSQTKLHLKYLYVPYDTHSDDAIRISDKMLEDYLLTHKRTYQVEESKVIQYVAFPMIPTEEDTKAFQKDLQDLKQSFAQAEDAQAFASIHTDGKPLMSRHNLTSQQLPGALSIQKSNLKEGMVIGPVQEKGVYKLYKIVSIHPAKAQQYCIAVIEKKPLPGDQTRDQLFKKADYCASTVKNTAQLEAYAAQEELQLHTAQVEKDAIQIGDFSQARELVRWLYTDAVVGRISPVFELEGAYVVAILTQQVPAGTAPLAQVREKIVPKVRNIIKAHAIMDKLSALKGKTLKEKMTQYGNGAKLLEANNLRFDDDNLQGVGKEQQAVGTAFALEPGVQTKVIGDNGVFMIEVMDKGTTEMLKDEDAAVYQQGLRNLAKIKQAYGVYQALEALANIKDYRYLFY